MKLTGLTTETPPTQQRPHKRRPEATQRDTFPGVGNYKAARHLSPRGVRGEGVLGFQVLNYPLSREGRAQLPK